MQIDQTNFINVSNDKIKTSGAAAAAIMQDMTGVEQTGLFAGSEQYTKAKVTRTGAVDMTTATYLRPNGKEETTAEALANETGRSALDRSNEMAVLANTTTPEDLAEAAKNGFDLSDTDSHTIVTVMDKIKANLAKMGVDISDMGSMSKKELVAITGNEALAEQIVSGMRQADLPTTEENVTETARAVEEASSLTGLDENAMAYMLKNSLAPSIASVYKAVHAKSETEGSTISDSAFAQMQGSMEQTLARAGMLSTEENLQDCKWMIKQDIPVVPKNVSYLGELKDLSQNLASGMDVESLLSAITTAITEGKRPEDAMLISGHSLTDIAKHCKEVVDNATEEDLAYLLDKGLPITIEGLEEAANVRSLGTRVVSPEEKALKLATAARQLEETRLAMTTEANLALLKRGISIDTKPLEQLVEDLKEEENALAKSLFAGAGVPATEENLSIFTETTNCIEELKYLPAKVLSLASDLDTIGSLHKEGVSLAAKYAAAGEKYEELMTAPRADLGDSIKKAFQNVDDILTDLGLETSDANKRAVRILAYNETEITTENISLMKARDEEVQRVFKNMTPQTVLEMIRRNENPLDMNLSDLNALASQINQETGKKEERFSKFLYDLDQKKAITKEERDSYIGIYRLFAQVEKTDGAAIGALVNQGAELTMRNLLMAVRSEKKSGMNYRVDDDFEGVTGKKTSAIDSQIMTSYNTNLVQDALDFVTMSGFAQAMEEGWEDKSIEQFAKDMVAAEDMAAEESYYATKAEQLQASVKASSDVYEILSRMDMPNTVENVLAADMFLHQPNEIFARLFKANDSTEEKLRKVRDMKDTVIERMGEAIKTPEEMAQAMDELGDLAENVMKTMIIEEPNVSSLDLQELRLLNQSLFFGKAQAQEENYVIPMETSDGVVTGISLKIIRGKEKKGFVDLMLRDAIMGKIAASFEAKADRISGLIAVDDEETKKLLSDNLPMIAEGLGEATGDAVDLSVAYVKDLSLESFAAQSEVRRSQMSGSQAEEGEKKQNTVQTSRLYGLAESFINSIKEFGTGSIF